MQNCDLVAEDPAVLWDRCIQLTQIENGLQMPEE